MEYPRVKSLRRLNRAVAHTPGGHGSRVPLRARWFAVAVLGLMIGASLALVVGVVPSSAVSGSGIPVAQLTPAVSGTANLSIVPASAYVDQWVNVTGSNFTADSGVNLTFNSTNIDSCLSGSNTTNSSGDFTCAFAVPEVPAGVYSVNATDGVNNATVNFTVLPPSLTLVPTSGFVKSLITASGTGYDFSTLITLAFGGSRIPGCITGNLTSNSLGDFSCKFKVPAFTAGLYSVDATDDNNTASQSYTIDSPTLTLTPSSGDVGSAVVAAGDGYKPSTALTLEFGSVQITTSQCSSGSLNSSLSGGFSCTFPVPVVPSGGYSVIATDGINAASKTYTVGAATLSPSPTFGNVGSSVTVTGTGYAPSAPLTLNFSATPISSCTSGSLTAGSSGDFSCAFTVPAAVAGSHLLEASDRTNSGTASFTVDPHMTLSTSSGIVGSSVTATGTGFDGSTTYTLTWDASVVSCTVSTTNSVGDFDCTFSVPSSTAGGHTVGAAENSNSANAPFTVDPAVVVSPTSGVVGTAIVVTGSGFDGSASATVTWDATTTLCSTTTNASGGIVCSSRVPSSPIGANTVAIAEGSFSPSATFSVTSSFSLSVGQGIVGTVVTLLGSGLLASTAYGYCLQTTQSACSAGLTFTTDPHGSIPSGTTLTIPSVASGPYYVDLSLSGSFVVSAPFLVTSASLQLSRTVGPVGTSVALSGGGFVNSTLYDYCFQRAAAACPGGTTTTFTSDGSGNIPHGTALSVPATSAGNYYVDVSEGSTLVTVAPFTLTPQLLLDPTSGFVGTSIQVNGTGMLSGASFLVLWNSTLPVCSGTTDSNGSFTCALFDAPPSPAGLVVLTASDGTNRPSANFTVESNLSATPSSGTVGTILNLTGTGFAANTAYVVKWDPSVTLCSGATDDQGGFSCRIAIPSAVAGPDVVTATAGATGATVSVTVLPSLDLSVPSGDVGTALTVTGAGFDADAAFSVTWNSTVSVCSSVTSATGTFGCVYVVPESPGGLYSIAAVEGANSAGASFTIRASLRISETIGFVGASETVTGTGFDAFSTYLLTWDSATNLCPQSPTDSNGSFGCTFVVPASPAGPHQIVATEGANLVSITFTVTSSLSLSPLQGPVGTSITAAGTGFSADSHYVIEWNGVVTLCSGTTNSQGGFFCTFSLPAEPAGSGTISGVQGSNQAGTTFTVTAAFALSQLSGTVGSLVNVTGTGFVDLESYTLVWNGSTVLCTNVTNASGSFACAFPVPYAPAGVHTLTALQGSTLTVQVLFAVLPNISLSPTDGTVGTVVTVVATGFNPGAHFIALWNASSPALCSGITNTNGGYTCTFAVPSGNAGTNTLTFSDGTHAPTVTFTVSATTPTNPGASAFPWWEVVLVVAVAVAVLLILGLFYEHRKQGTSPSSLKPYRPVPPSRPTPSPGTPVEPFGTGAVVAGGIAEGASAGPSADTGEEPEDIDLLIARLERMSVQMFKKSPKELADYRAVGEESPPGG
jgi:hypothetical protein